MSAHGEDGENLMTQALPVSKFTPDFDPNKVPTCAEEYLQKVMWEAQQCKEVVTVDLDKSKIKKVGPIVKKQTKLKAPAEYYPTKAVQKEFLTQFSQLRERIERCRIRGNFPRAPQVLPCEEDQDAWCLFCFGNSFQRELLKKQDGSASIPDLIEGRQPLLSILLNISQICLENLIEWHSHWLEVFGFSESQGRWFFSLVACVQKPLTPELCAQLRHILLMCATLRASLESSDHPHLLHLNMLITIIANYFDQDDLADT